MRDAQRKPTSGDHYSPETHHESVDILDETSVLEHLEADLNSDEDRDRIVGIGNGLLAGAAVWIFLFVAASLLF